MAQAPSQRAGRGFAAGALIGALGGLIGLGGAEFRLPVLVGVFRLPVLEAIILNKAMSLIVVAAARVFRTGAISVGHLAGHLDIVLNPLAGSLAGAWYAAGHAITLPRRWLNRMVMVMLFGLGLLMLGEPWFDLGNATAPLIEDGGAHIAAGVFAGFGIGAVAALLGVAGGELLIPTIVLLYGIDIKLAGSLSLMVSLPTMILGFARYSRSHAFAVVGQERTLFRWMTAGSVLGAGVGVGVGVGGIIVAWVPTNLLISLLGIVLLASTVKAFRHAR